MKAYVIKRDDGKYQTDIGNFVTKICFAEIFNDYEMALCCCFDDCNIVAIEIKEIEN